ncbi:hypothetical protein HOY80DRAFT_1075627 [Tuber brumale]|nr:hypothetical protein HOY80DRAFT_1075627 [Tuber brumale]
METPTAPGNNALGPAMTDHLRVPTAGFENTLLLKQLCIASCGPGAYESSTLLLGPSTPIGSQFYKGVAHPPEIIAQSVESLAISQMFDINQEFFHMIKTSKGYLWRGWKGKFTPPNRGHNAVKPSGAALGQSKSKDCKEIYSWCKLECCHQYFGSCKRQVGSHKVEALDEAGEGLEWWEIESDEDGGVSYGSDDSEHGSDEETDISVAESEEEESDSDGDDDTEWVD